MMAKGLPLGIRYRLLVCVLAPATLLAAPQIQAQTTEVQVAGLWARDVAAGGYVGVHRDWLLGAVRVDTTWVDMGGGQQAPITTRLGRVWTLTGWTGLGIVNGPGERGLEPGIHGQLGVTRRRPGALVDRIGVMADGYAIQWAVGASAAVRLKAAFWVHGGAVHSEGAVHPAFGIRVQQSILTELFRFLD